LAFWTRLGAVLLVSACPVLLMADAVNISSFCTLTNYDTSVSPPTTAVASQVNSSGGCAATLADSLPVPDGPLTPVGGRIDADIGVFPKSTSLAIYATGIAQFSISVDLLFSTPGPVRNGFIALSYIEDPRNGADSPSQGSRFVSIGDLSTDHGLSVAGGAGMYPLMPFVLGQNFSFHEDLSEQAFANPNFGIFESASPIVNWTFTLFEADGVTPVQVALATPEPSSAMLWAGGLWVLLTLIPRSSHWEE
jgi:hypothetical protein